MKQSGLMQRLEKQADRRVEEARRHSRIFMMDMVTIALGRMGRWEAFFREFDKVLDEVCTEYGKLILEDAGVDNELVYSKACLDREMKQYTGGLFADYDTRYGEVVK